MLKKNRVPQSITGKLARFNITVKQSLSSKVEYKQIHIFKHIGPFQRKPYQFRDLGMITCFEDGNQLKIILTNQKMTYSLFQIESLLQNFPKQQLRLIGELSERKLNFSIKFPIVDGLEFIKTLYYNKNKRSYVGGYKAFYICVHFTFIEDRQKNRQIYIATSIYPVLRLKGDVRYGKDDREFYVEPDYKKMSKMNRIAIQKAVNDCRAQKGQKYGPIV